MGEPYYIMIGDCIASMRRRPANSVHCCVTSPPYWMLRDYGMAGQIGLELTPAEYVARMVEVFREVRRVLRPDGTCWVNVGDSFASSGTSGLKPKDLVGIPWMLAFALRDDGWWLRQDLLWHKPNPMPESVTDRCTKAHEYVFLLSKSERYFYDAEAVKESATTAGQTIKMADGWDTGEGGHGTFHRNGREKGKSSGEIQPDTRNARSVWTIATQPYREAHFATFPLELPTRCIKAGTSERGCCPTCGAPWRRIVEKERVATRPGTDTKVTGDTLVDGNRDPERHVTTTRTTGWQQTCDCPAHEPIPCTVLDPFSGSGTTGEAACTMGRDYIGCELNPEYAAMSLRRIGKALRPSTFRHEAETDDATLFAEAAHGE